MFTKSGQNYFVICHYCCSLNIIVCIVLNANQKTSAGLSLKFNPSKIRIEIHKTRQKIVENHKFLQKPKMLPLTGGGIGGRNRNRNKHQNSITSEYKRVSLPCMPHSWAVRDLLSLSLFRFIWLNTTPVFPLSLKRPLQLNLEC